jgi:hypothetical protein
MRRVTIPRVAGATVALAGTLGFPAAASAHTITEKYSAPLPIVVYVAGAALAVAMSFLFVSLRDRRATPSTAVSRPREVPGWLRWVLRALGLIGWLWIMAQAFFGGSDPAADIAQILLWIYGWVGVALICALIGPVWAWLDPFSTMHLLLVGAGRRLGLLSAPDEDNADGAEDADEADDEDADEGDVEGDRYPARFGRWPAVIGFIVVVWLELVVFVTGGRTLALLLLGYTLITLAGMSWFGRSTWRNNVEIFSVWFSVLGRLAPFALVAEPEDNRVARRPFASGLFAIPWTVAELVLVAIATGAIIFDGLSQTRLYFDLFGRVDLFGLPPVVLNTLILTGWLALVVGLVFAVARRIGINGLGAGLLPVAVGYLIAHYVLALVFDGQRIVIAINDPLVRGDSLLPYPLSNMIEPWPFLPASIIWTIQLAAVVGGHVLGAWAGHAALAGTRQGARMANQLPLAALMVVFTSVTLWSLGQAVIQQPTQTANLAAPAAFVSLDRDDRPGP